MERDELILKYLPEVQRLVGPFVLKRPNLASVEDDLLSVGSVKLIETIDRFLDENRPFDDHFVNYFRISIVTGISDFIRSNSLIPRPKEKWVTFTVWKGEGAVEESSPTDLTHRETLEFLFDACGDRYDAAIIQAKLDGAKTVAAVVRATGFSKNTVLKHLKAIRERYQKLTHDKPPRTDIGRATP